MLAGFFNGLFRRRLSQKDILRIISKESGGSFSRVQEAFRTTKPDENGRFKLSDITLRLQDIRAREKAEEEERKAWEKGPQRPLPPRVP